MSNTPDFKWLFLDLNSYFASVEQNENPHLRGKPVAVVPMDTPHTCAIAASYEAKAYGIKTGTLIRDAKQMCPNLVCIQARHDVYAQYHTAIIEEIIKHTPINKIWSIDELSSRLPPNKRTPEGVAMVARNIKRGLWDNIGPSISCSIGIAPNSLLAKIASDMQKPDGLTVLHKGTLLPQLSVLKLTDLPGIGVNMAKRLNRAGISTIEQLWNLSPKHARKVWGSVQGERFWYLLRGHDIGEPETQGNVMIGHSRVLDPHLRTPAHTRQMARRLLMKASYRLRRKASYASTLCFGVRTVDRYINNTLAQRGIKWRQDIHLPSPAQDPFTFLTHLDTLWDRMMGDFGQYHDAPLKFKKVSVLLMGLKTKHQITEDLFESAQTDLTRKTEKNTALTAALDHLQGKYKAETVTLGVPPKTLAGHVGTKIAFSRVPDQEEFWS